VKARAIKPIHGGKVDPTPGRTSAASVFGITPTKVKKAGALLSTAPEMAAKVLSGEIKIGTALSSLKRREQLAGIERATCRRVSSGSSSRIHRGAMTTRGVPEPLSLSTRP